MTAAASEQSVVPEGRAPVVLCFNWALCHEHPDLIGGLLARLSTACFLWIQVCPYGVRTLTMCLQVVVISDNTMPVRYCIFRSGNIRCLLSNFPKHEAAIVLLRRRARLSD